MHGWNTKLHSFTFTQSIIFHLADNIQSIVEQLFNFLGGGLPSRWIAWWVACLAENDVMLEPPEGGRFLSLLLLLEKAIPAVLVVLGAPSIVTGEAIVVRGSKVFQVDGLEGLLGDLWVATQASLWIVVVFPIRWNCTATGLYLSVAVVSPKVRPLHGNLL